MYAGSATDIITAVTASKASISLKSFFSKPFTVIHFHVLPPLFVLPTVPLLPLTQATLSFTTLNPRRLVLAPEVRISTTGVWALMTITGKKKATKKENR